MIVDWSELFGLSLPVAEIVVRGTATYWFLFLIFRFAVRRDVGAVGLADILLLVIVADASQNAMAGEYKTVTDGIVLVSTLIFWNMTVDWLSFRFAAFRRFAEPSSLRLVKDGRMLMRNMRKEFITEEELRIKLREQGIDSIEQVKAAFLEPDGEVSVIPKSG
ncbi:MAG TPA: YetF domain-containing protein [Burkholderiaceae bacterium]|nr:YetF domain-containing protein [Burkholderiaceae bacterium]